MIPARDALARLRDGNQRFAANVRGPDASPTLGRRIELVTGQEPFAIVLGSLLRRAPRRRPPPPAGGAP